MAPRACTVDGCESRRRARGLCATHYDRWWRTGSVGEASRRRGANGTGNVRPDGYVKVRVGSHPIADVRGQVFAHRLVLFAKLGSGTQTCHWCGRDVRWLDGTLIVDHLDFDRANNVPDNLVPSCNPCNGGRTRRWAVA